MNHTTRAVLAGLAAALLSLLAVASSAQAATYRVTQCDGKRGVRAPDAERFVFGADVAFANWCARSTQYAGLALGATPGASNPSGTAAGWIFFAPRGTQFVRASASMRSADAGGVLPELRLGDKDGLLWGGALNNSDQYVPYVWGGATGPTNAILVQLHRRTVPFNCPDPAGAYVRAHDFLFELSESAPPTIERAGGSLLESAPARSLRGLAVLGVSAADVGAGLSSAYVEAAGKRVATAAFNCAVTADGVAKRLVPCPRQVDKFLGVNTANSVFHTGLNQGVRVCVTDFVGQRDCQDGPPVRIDNACPSAGAPVASLVGVRFRGGVGSSGQPNVKKTRFGREVKLRGQALDGAGNPVPGATICLGHRLPADTYAGEEVNWTKTGPKGRFRFKLERGPNQAFRIAAWRAGNAIEQYRTLMVKAKPKLKIKGKPRPRRRIRLRAKLNPPRIAGKEVRFEAKANAGWVSVPKCANVSTDAKGKAGCRFKVPAGTAGSKLRFRAVVPHAAAYPYLRGHSRVQSKRVRG